MYDGVLCRVLTGVNRMIENIPVIITRGFVIERI